MNVFQTSWRRSLAAAALVAVLSPFSADAIAQEEREEEVPVLFDEEGPPREERREREHPEARERARGERERGEREVLMHQVEVLGIAAHALREAERGDAIELVERAIHARKVTLEGRRDDEAHMIRERAPGPEQLADVLAMAAGLWREFGNQDKAHAVAELAEVLRAPRDRERERPRRDREREERERPGPDERVQQLKREYEQMKGRAHQIENELRGRPRDEKARELQEAAREIHERMEVIEQQLAQFLGERHPMAREIARRHRELEEERESDLRAAIAGRLDELKAALHRAREAGRPDEAGRIERVIEEIKRHVERHPDRDVPHPEHGEEMERRMHHVRVAVENLHAAGLHEQAERLAQQMEHMRHPDRPHPEALEHPSRGEGPPPGEHLEGVIRELHEAVRHLHERMDEMARHMEGEIEAIHREMGEFAEEFEEEEEEEEEEEGHDDDDHDEDHDDEDDHDEDDDDHHEEEEEDDD